jgi:hypothetical protein
MRVKAFVLRMRWRCALLRTARVASGRAARLPENNRRTQQETRKLQCSPLLGESGGGSSHGPGGELGEDGSPRRIH